MPLKKRKTRCRALAAPDTLDARFAQALGQLLGPDFPSDIALAVSGGGDSMAMLALAHSWARVWGVRLHVVTVDHGLRDESAAEAEMVAAECAALGHAHTTLRWHWDGQGNVMDAARRARLNLIGAWRGEIGHVLMAHNADDVAETFLLRLARGSGVEGLAAMRPRRPVLQGFDVIRPCLDMTRAELRHYARTLKMPWVDDPTNDNPKYDRSRARQMRETLAGLGLEPDRLIGTATRMAEARTALWARAVSVAESCITEHPSGTLIFARDRFALIERDTQLRLLAAAVMWVSGATYRPRLTSLEDALNRVLSGGAATLSGAKLETGGENLFVFRELAAAERAGPNVQDAPKGTVLWDAKWRISGPKSAIRPLGDAVSAFEEARGAGVPRAALMAMPALWDGQTCLATPVLSAHPDWKIGVHRTFSEFLLSH